MIDYANLLWPMTRKTRWTHAWSGQLAVTSDHYPHLHQPDETVMICLGYNGRGVAMATAMGAAMAAKIMGEEIALPVTTISEIPFHGLWKAAVQARVLYGRIRDALGV